MAAPIIAPYEGEVPQRTQAPAVFSDNVDDFLTYIPPMVDEMNVSVDFVNSAAVLSESSNNLAATIITASNFQGSWSGLTGALSPQTTLHHIGLYWQVLVPIANVTLSEPSLVNTDYALSAQAGDHVVIQSPFTLTESGRYYVLGSGTITIPDPTGFPDGKTFNFKRQPNETPLIDVDAITDKVSTRLGLFDGVLMGVSQHEMIVRNDLYEV